MIATIYNQGNVSMTDSESSNNGGILGGTLYSVTNQRISGANKVSYGYNTGIVSSNSDAINQVSPYYLTDTSVSENGMYYINTNTTNTSRYGKAVYKSYLIFNESYAVYPVLNRFSGSGIWKYYSSLTYIDFVWESEME